MSRNKIRKEIVLFKKGAERRVKRGEECLSDECPSGECFANVCDVYEELREVKKR
jgi:hypothetical protein